LRSLAWKLFLGCLPLDLEHKEWPQVFKIHRKEYTALRSQYLIDPYSSGKELDPQINNPLSQNEESPWTKFFANAELEKEINQDIDRTYPENEFFQTTEVKEMMLRILFIYARQTPQLSYKQGMHELLAPFIYVLHKEYHLKQSNQTDPLNQTNTDATQNIDEELENLLDAAYVEHDSFMMFSHLMKTVKEWFVHGSSSPKKNQDGIFVSDLDPTSPVVDKCKFIQNQILSQKDPELFQYLAVQLKIEPQLYMLRWVRLLLGREFHLDDLLGLWDGIFGYSKDLILIDYLCVAMLIYIRRSLLDRDYTGCMKRLFKYPPVEDVHLFVEQAVMLINVSHNQASLEKIASSKTQKKKSLTPLNAVKNILSGEENQTMHRLRAEVFTLRNTQTHMANRLERIIYSIQKEVVEGAVGVSNSESFIIALAELKQVKDILSGLISDSSLTVEFSHEIVTPV